MNRVESMELGCSLQMANASIGATLAMLQRLNQPQLAVPIQNARRDIMDAMARLDEMNEANKKQTTIPL